MDNTGGHALNLPYDDVQTELLPPNISLIQPMDRSVIHIFKALYIQNFLQHLVEAMDTDDNFSLMEYWCGYTIAMCLQNIQKAIKEMKTETLNASWKKMHSEVVHGDKGFSPDENHHSAVDKTVNMAKLLGGDGFMYMTSKDVNNLIKAHSDLLTEEDLREMIKSASEEEEDPG